MIRYRDTITIPDDLVGGEVVANIVEYLTGIGWVDRVTERELTFEIRVDGDLWDLHERAAEIEVELRSRGVDYVAAREKVVAS